MFKSGAALVLDCDVGALLNSALTTSGEQFVPLGGFAKL